MRKTLAKVDDGRLGRAIAGLITGALKVERVVRREREICAEIVSTGKRGTKRYGVAIAGRRVFCSCADYRERGVHCKHIAALALHELGAAAAARSERREVEVL